MFGGKLTSRVGSFTKAVASSVFKKPAAAAPAQAAAAAAAPANAPASAPVEVAEQPKMDRAEFIDALASHAGLSMLQARAACASGKFKAEGRFWCVERAGYSDDKLLLRAQLDVELIRLPAASLLGMLTAASFAARLFGCAMWLDDDDQTLQVSWHLGDLGSLSTEEVVDAFDAYNGVVDSIESALNTGLAANASAA